MTWTKLWSGVLLGSLACGLPASSANASWREDSTIEASCEILDELAGLHVRAIPPSLLQDAQGVVIIPNMVKAGFVVGGRHGRGVMLVREGDNWGKPMFVSITGGSFGWQIGVQATDLVLVFKTRAGVERVLRGKGKVTLGADIAVAAGPVGRQAQAATDLQLKSEIFSYSRSRGLFAGLSLDGAALIVNHDETEAYYRTPRAGVFDPRLGQVVPMTPPEAKLQLKLAQLSMKGEPAPVILTPPVGAPVIGTPPPPGAPGPVIGTPPAPPPPMWTPVPTSTPTISPRPVATPVAPAPNPIQPPPPPAQSPPPPVRPQ